MKVVLLLSLERMTRLRIQVKKFKFILNRINFLCAYVAKQTIIKKIFLYLLCYNK